MLTEHFSTKTLFFLKTQTENSSAKQWLLFLNWEICSLDEFAMIFIFPIYETCDKNTVTLWHKGFFK